FVVVPDRAVGVVVLSSAGRVADLCFFVCFTLGVPAVIYAPSLHDALPIYRAALGHGGAVVVGDRRVVDRRDRNRDGGRGAALGVGRAVGRAVVTGFVGEGVARGLAAEIGRASCRDGV